MFDGVIRVDTYNQINITSLIISNEILKTISAGVQLLEKTFRSGIEIVDGFCMLEITGVCK